MTENASPGHAEPGRLARPAAVSGWQRWLPGLQMLRHYRPAWLVNDLSAGLVLTSMLVPVGIAYAVASGVPGIYGLYATIIPLLAYALFGPSRILVLGPDSSLVTLILAVVLPLSLGDPARAIALASMMALVSGTVCVLAGVLRLGFITELLSKPIRYGYMNGIALTVLLSQMPKLFGFKVDSDGPMHDVWSIGEKLVRWEVSSATFLIGAGTLASILLLKPYKRIPGILLAVIGATVAVAALDLDRTHGVAVLGSLPQGLPSFALPWIGLADLQNVIIGGCAVALVSFADTSVLSRTYAARTRSHVDPNQEMIGLGAANLAAGFFQGFPISSSSSRTPVAEAAGSKTQLTGVVGATAVALLLLFAPNLLQNLPTSALAAVVMASAIGLFEFDDLRRIYRIQNWEFWLSMCCFVGVAVLGAIPGIGLAIVLAVIEFLWDGWRPHSTVLGRVDGVRGYHDIKRYPACAPDTRFGAVPLGCAAVLRQCRTVRIASSGRHRRITDTGQAHRRLGRAGHQRRRNLCRCVERALPHPASRTDRTAFRRNEGSGERQAQALRTARGARQRHLSPDAGRRRRCLSRTIRC